MTVEVTEAEEQLAYVWTLLSEARVGSYQHEVSSAPWIILHAERGHLDAIRAGSTGDKG